MKTRMEQALEKNLRGREVAVWGTPTRLMLRALRGYRFHAARTVDVARHYVVAVSDEDLADFLLDGQSKPFRHARDYVTFQDFGGELPFEWACYGVTVGRQTYFGDGFVSACEEGYIESIGHFTSINGSAQIHVDHQLSMCFVSDDIVWFFADEDKAAFHQGCLADPKHPYGLGKPRVTIGNDVWIGANAFISASRVTRIGDGAVIGAGAVVLEDVPPYAVVAGVPARVKRYRYPAGMIETLLRVKWWHWSAEEIRDNARTLMSPGLFMEKYGRGAGK